jgi:hypothetical protein
MRGWQRLGIVLSVFWFAAFWFAALATFLPLPARADELYSYSVMVMPRVVVTPENAHVPSPVNCLMTKSGCRLVEHHRCRRVGGKLGARVGAFPVWES